MPNDLMSDDRISENTRKIYEALTDDERRAVDYLVQRNRRASNQLGISPIKLEELLPECIETVQFEGAQNVLSRYGFYADAPVVSEHWRNNRTLPIYETPPEEKNKRRKKE